MYCVLAGRKKAKDDERYKKYFRMKRLVSGTVIIDAVKFWVNVHPLLKNYCHSWMLIQKFITLRAYYVFNVISSIPHRE